MEGTIVEKRYYNAESLERSLIVLKPTLGLARASSMPRTKPTMSA